MTPNRPTKPVKPKAVKAWAAVFDHGIEPFAIYSRRAVAREAASGLGRVIPVLITPISPKWRKK